MSGHQFIPRIETTVRIHKIHNTWLTRNVPSSPGREYGREYTFLASLTAIQLISG
jgi:hypothetical protein